MREIIYWLIVGVNSCLLGANFWMLFKRKKLYEDAKKTCEEITDTYRKNVFKALGWNTENTVVKLKMVVKDD